MDVEIRAEVAEAHVAATERAVKVIVTPGSALSLDNIASAWIPTINVFALGTKARAPGLRTIRATQTTSCFARGVV